MLILDPALLHPLPLNFQELGSTHSFNNAKFANASYVRFSHWYCT
jgi:hypothetical protein